MKTLIISIVAILIAIATAFFIHKDPGQVVIDFQGLRYGPMSLGIVLAGLGAAFVAFYIVIRLFFALTSAPKTIKERHERKQLIKSHDDLGKGLLEYVEGNYEKASSLLTRQSSPNNSCTAINLINAAKAAHKLQQFDKSNDYLEKAATCSEASKSAAQLTQAELLLQRHESREAVKLLSAIHSASPKNTRAIYLLVQAYQSINNWESMSELLVEARKHQVAPKDELLDLEVIAAIGSLKNANVDNVSSIYEGLASHLKQVSEIAYNYAERLNNKGKADEASEIVKNALTKQWSDKLVSLFGDIKSDNLSAQITQAEKWATENGNSASLSLALSKLYYNNNQWGNAKESAISSIETTPSMSAFFALGKALEAVDDQNGALLAYKHGYAVDDLASQKSEKSDLDK